MKNKTIEELKKEARDYVLAYDMELGNYNCGATLAEHMSPTLSHYKLEFNRIMDELSKVDPLTPDFRL